MNETDKKTLTALKDKIGKSETSPPLFSVFDADGTLWKEDANNIFLNYQEKHKLRKVGFLKEEPFRPDSERQKKCERFTAIQAGFTLEEFHHHCRKALEETPLTPFPLQRELLSYLKARNHLIYVVTASLKLLVEEACRLYSLPVDKVLGAETALTNGKFTDQILRPFPFGPGKKTTFLKATKNIRPIFSAGNTESDKPLLETAKVRLVVHSAKQGEENFKSEQKISASARERSWFVWEPAEIN